ncbi:hypothetical protein V2W45_528632 [Cenococcum geophilum]
MLSENECPSATVIEIAIRTKPSLELMSRLLKFLVSHNMVQEIEEDRFAPSKITRYLAIPGIRAGIYYAVENCALPYLALPDFLALHKYEPATDPMDSPFQLGQRTESHLFQWALSKPARMTAFNEYMSV